METVHAGFKLFACRLDKFKFDSHDEGDFREVLLSVPTGPKFSGTR
jgi:hypothetical protein